MGKKAFILSAAAKEDDFPKWSDCWINPCFGKLVTSQRSFPGKQYCFPKYKHHSGMGKSNMHESVNICCASLNGKITSWLSCKHPATSFLQEHCVSSAWKRRQWPPLSFAVQSSHMRVDLRTLPFPLPSPCSNHRLSPMASNPSFPRLFLPVSSTWITKHSFPQHCRALSLLPALGTAGMLGDTMRCHFPQWHLPCCSRNGNRSIRTAVLKCSDNIFCSNSHFPASLESNWIKLEGFSTSNQTCWHGWS